MSGFSILLTISFVIFMSFTIPYMLIQDNKPGGFRTEDGEYYGPDIIGLPIILFIVLAIINMTLHFKLDNTNNFEYVKFDINSENYTELTGLKFLELEKYRDYKTVETKKEDGTIQMERVLVSNEPIFLSIRNNRYYFYIKLGGPRQTVYLDFDDKFVFDHKGTNNLEIVITKDDEFKVEGTKKKFKNKFTNWYYGNNTEKFIKVYMPERFVSK